MGQNFILSVNPLLTAGLFQYLPKYQKTPGFWMFSGGIERNQWHEMS